MSRSTPFLSSGSREGASSYSSSTKSLEDLFLGEERGSIPVGYSPSDLLNYALLKRLIEKGFKFEEAVVEKTAIFADQIIALCMVQASINAMQRIFTQLIVNLKFPLDKRQAPQEIFRAVMRDGYYPLESFETAYNAKWRVEGIPSEKLAKEDMENPSQPGEKQPSLLEEFMRELTTGLLGYHIGAVEVYVPWSKMAYYRDQLKAHIGLIEAAFNIFVINDLKASDPIAKELAPSYKAARLKRIEDLCNVIFALPEALAAMLKLLERDKIQFITICSTVANVIKNDWKITHHAWVDVLRYLDYIDYATPWVALTSESKEAVLAECGRLGLNISLSAINPAWVVDYVTIGDETVDIIGVVKSVRISSDAKVSGPVKERVKRVHYTALGLNKNSAPRALEGSNRLKADWLKIPFQAMAERVEIALRKAVADYYAFFEEDTVLKALMSFFDMDGSGEAGNIYLNFGSNTHYTGSDSEVFTLSLNPPSIYAHFESSSSPSVLVKSPRPPSIPGILGYAHLSKIILDDASGVNVSDFDGNTLLLWATQSLSQLVSAFESGQLNPGEQTELRAFPEDLEEFEAHAKKLAKLDNRIRQITALIKWLVDSGGDPRLENRLGLCAEVFMLGSEEIANLYYDVRVTHINWPLISSILESLNKHWIRFSTVNLPDIMDAKKITEGNLESLREKVDRYLKLYLRVMLGHHQVFTFVNEIKEINRIYPFKNSQLDNGTITLLGKLEAQLKLMRVKMDPELYLGEIFTAFINDFYHPFLARYRSLVDEDVRELVEKDTKKPLFVGLLYL